MNAIQSRFDWKLLGIALLAWLAGSGLFTTLIVFVLGWWHKYQPIINKLFERVV